MILMQGITKVVLHSLNHPSCQRESLDLSQSSKCLKLLLILNLKLDTALGVSDQVVYNRKQKVLPFSSSYLYTRP